MKRLDIGIAIVGFGLLRFGLLLLVAWALAPLTMRTQASIVPVPEQIEAPLPPPLPFHPVEIGFAVLKKTTDLVVGDRWYLIKIRRCEYILLEGHRESTLTHAGDCPNPIHKGAK